MPGDAAGSGELVPQPNSVATLPLLADGRIHIAEHISNSGQIAANGAVDLHTQSSLKNQGTLSLNQLTAEGTLLHNQRGVIR